MGKLKPGAAAPDFTAQTDEGRKLSLSELRGKAVVLYFYPKDNTPGCTTQACLFRDLYPDLEQESAVVLGVSPDGEESHRKFRSKHALPFTLLVDDDHAMAKAYGVWGEKSMYGRKYLGIVRSHFVIDEQGNLLDVQYKINPKKSAEQALNVLKDRVKD